jgi:hypothetical protein
MREGLHSVNAMKMKNAVQHVKVYLSVTRALHEGTSQTAASFACMAVCVSCFKLCRVKREQAFLKIYCGTK